MAVNVLNNQPDALIIPILFCYKTLHVSGIFSAHHQEFCTVHSTLLSFMQVSDDRIQTESGWNCSALSKSTVYKLYMWDILHRNSNYCRFTHLRGHAVALLVEELRYEPEGRGIDSRWCNFNWLNPCGSTMTLELTQPLTYMSTENIY